jgi:hypothetical protein
MEGTGRFDSLRLVTLDVQQEYRQINEPVKVSTLQRLEASLAMTPLSEEELDETRKGKLYRLKDGKRRWCWKTSVYQPMNWNKVWEENDWTDAGFRAHVTSQDVIESRNKGIDIRGLRCETGVHLIRRNG